MTTNYSTQHERNTALLALFARRDLLQRDGERTLATGWPRRACDRCRSAMARRLLKYGGWEFHGPSLRQGAAGTAHFEPDGVIFWG